MKRQIEVFVAGCPLCSDAVAVVKEIACDDCDITVLNMQDGDTAEQARRYGIHAVPAVVVDGKLADCCSRGPINPETLKAADIGRPRS